uniref:Stealth protein CR2 conserved region 2 domain-containing protein n=1 Tax=viral metagenome TaxID=1070528 RepID=A0A6C0BQ62_9ZZZZ
MSLVVDVVYTWVTDTLAHRQKRRTYLGTKKAPKDNGINRYSDHSELKYSIRSIYKFAPWVHAIYIVCDDDQRPAWLHRRSEECNIPIYVIKHSTIIPIDHLPTFNSQAIEAHLHRIPGLSEHFIYFNDDMFLGNACTTDDFFTSEGRPRYYLHGSTASRIVPNMSKHAYAWFNNNRLLDHLFGKRAKRPYPTHQAVAMLKSSFEAVWNHDVIRPHLERTSSSRFRETHNVYLIGFLVYWNIQHRLAGQGRHRGMYLNYSDALNYHYALLRIELSKPVLFCINDNLCLRRKIGEMHLARFFRRFFNWTTIAEL